MALSVVAALAAGFRLSNLAAIGDANPYFTAGVLSMQPSWYHFLFAVAEPGGSVTLDKPPVGFWVQAAFGAVFGVTGITVSLPQLLAGIGSVVVLTHVLARTFGLAAGVAAGIVLATTPVTIAVERTNKLDGLLIFVLVLAVWALLRATERGHLRPLLLSAALLGLACNIKMLQALIPLPAMGLCYLLTAPIPWVQRIRHLGFAALVLIPLALVWVFTIDAIPPAQRPYIGGSADNTAHSLFLEYNGLQRLTGASPSLPNVPRPPPAPSGSLGPFGSGHPGVFRLFAPGLAAQVSWLLPWVLGCLVILLWRAHLTTDRVLLQHLVLWGGWLLTGVVLFSSAGWMHPYYLAMLGPPVAALAVLGSATWWQAPRARWSRDGLIWLGAAATVGVQGALIQVYEPLTWWFGLPLLLLGVGGAWLLLRARAPFGGRLVIGAALLIVPLIWAGRTTALPVNNGVLPQAYPGPAPALRTASPLMPATTSALLAALGPVDTHYLLVVPNAIVGAPFVLATARPVFYAGGYNGADPVLTPQHLVDLVDVGAVRYVLWGPGGPRATTAAIAAYLHATCPVHPASGRLPPPWTLYRCAPAIPHPYVPLS